MERFVVGIAGGSGAGKTTLAEGLAGCIYPGSAIVIHEDGYYKDNTHLPEASREIINYDHPDAIDLDLLAGQVRQLICGETIKKPIYDFIRHIRKEETETILPAKLVIVEGLFTLFNKLLVDALDLKVFLYLPEDLRLSRRLERDIRERGRTKESVVKQWNTTVQPMHQLFIEPSRSFAHMVLSGSDRIDSNVGRMRDFMVSRKFGPL